MTKLPFVDSSFDVPVFYPGDDLIACLNKEMAFLTAIASSRFPSTNNPLRTSSNLRNHDTIQDGRVTTEDLDTYDSDCDNISNTKAVLMANGKEYHQKEKIKAKPNTIEHEMKSVEKLKVNQSQQKVNPIKVKDGAEVEEL
nr:hypothetical protein [Tanacetum cinerariifolium]